jgi:hypothetical protein
MKASFRCILGMEMFWVLVLWIVLVFLSAKPRLTSAVYAAVMIPAARTAPVL